MKVRVDNVHVSLLPDAGIQMAEDTTILVKGPFPVNATSLGRRLQRAATFSLHSAG
jgi:hypothetical protein